MVTVCMRVARRKSMCVIIANDKTTVFALVLIDFLTGHISRPIRCVLCLIRFSLNNCRCN